MALFSRKPSQSSADDVRDAVAQAHSASNQALQEMAEERSPERRSDNQGDFDYLIATPDQTVHSIPIAQFHRQYQLCLEALELTIYGYCVHLKFGWEKRDEVVFSLRRPPIWRRILNPAPLLALAVSADEGDVDLGFNAADRPGYKNRENHIVRLDEKLQEQLDKVNREQIAATSIKSRVASWLNRFRKK